LNGANVGYEQLGEGFHRNVAPGQYDIAADSSVARDSDQSATVDLAARREVYLKIEEMGWPGGGEGRWSSQRKALIVSAVCGGASTLTRLGVGC
jgi:hypothetical protein